MSTTYALFTVACLFTFSFRVLISVMAICLTNLLTLYFGLRQNIVNAICDDEDIRAVSFVGSNTVNFFPVFGLWQCSFPI